MIALWLALSGCAASPGLAPDPAFAVAACEVSDREGLVVVDVAEPPATVRLSAWRTDDRGATFALAHTEDATTAAVAARGDAVWIAAHLRRAGVFPMLIRSDDRGRTWTGADAPPLPEGAEIEALALADGQVAALSGGAWTRSADGGASWGPADAPPEPATCPSGGWLRVTPTPDGWRVERRVRRGWREVAAVPRYVVAP